MFDAVLLGNRILYCHTIFHLPAKKKGVRLAGGQLASKIIICCLIKTANVIEKSRT